MSLTTSFVFNELAPGLHTFTESSVEGWELTAIDCSGTNGAAVDTETGSVAITMLAGEDIVCTFVNQYDDHQEQSDGKITISKSTGRHKTRERFSFVIGEQSFSLKSGHKQTFRNLSGTQTVIEQPVDGWWLKDVYCTGVENYQQIRDEATGQLVGVDIQLREEAHKMKRHKKSPNCTFYNAPTNSISGYKFEDGNADHHWDKESESGRDGWAIDLFRPCSQNVAVRALELSEEELAEEGCEPQLIASTITGTGGKYRFDNLANGTYIVCEQQRDGWIQTSPEDTYWYGISSRGKNQQSYYVEDGCYYVEIDGKSVSRINFGNFQLSAVNGIEFHDLNKNGVQDVDEPYLVGWEISLYKLETPEPEGEFTLFSLLDPAAVFVASTLTDASGFYSFTGLELGDYQVCQTPQTGWTRTFPVDGNCQDFSIISSGEVVTPVDFGNWIPEPQVLGTSTLTNTGTSAMLGLIVALSIVGVASSIVTMGRQKQN